MQPEEKIKQVMWLFVMMGPSHTTRQNQPKRSHPLTNLPQKPRGRGGDGTGNVEPDVNRNKLKFEEKKT
jgi:hypothetical protein